MVAILTHTPISVCPGISQIKTTKLINMNVWTTMHILPTSANHVPQKSGIDHFEQTVSQNSINKGLVNELIIQIIHIIQKKWIVHPQQIQFFKLCEYKPPKRDIYFIPLKPETITEWCFVNSDVMWIWTMVAVVKDAKRAASASSWSLGWFNSSIFCLPFLLPKRPRVSVQGFGQNHHWYMCLMFVYRGSHPTVFVPATTVSNNHGFPEIRIFSCMRVLSFPGFCHCLW